MKVRSNDVLPIFTPTKNSEDSLAIENVMQDL